MTAPTPCPQGRTDYDACFAPFRYCPIKGCNRFESSDETPLVEQALEILVREHFDALHDAGLCIPYVDISERTKRLVGQQFRGHVEALDRVGMLRRPS